MSAARRVGVLGGTFDPVHLGHLVVASEVHHALGLDEVVLVPAGDPWQKAHRELTPAAERVRMARLAVADDPRLSVSTVDADRPGPTYSVDTARDLRSVYGADAELYFLVGADALARVPTWHQVDRLLADVLMVGCARRGHPLAVPADLPEDRFLFVETTVLDISSTDLRERAHQGAPLRYLVPDAVEAHVRATGLYRDAA